eukprot:350396-Chlamydomonas_euryale.AAC.4
MLAMLHNWQLGNELIAHAAQQRADRKQPLGRGQLLSVGAGGASSCLWMKCGPAVDCGLKRGQLAIVSEGGASLRLRTCVWQCQLA